MLMGRLCLSPQSGNSMRATNNMRRLSDRGLYKYLTRSQIIVNRRNRNSRCGINNIDS
ncbi:unnamed protein product [Brassica oleracea var. botrytis]